MRIGSSPLQDLDERQINGLTLYLAEIKPLRMSGWTGFKLYVRNSGDFSSNSPVIKGIHSVGGKDGVRPWMDLEYDEEPEFTHNAGHENNAIPLSVSSAQRLFEYLGDIIPPGGHLMVSYEGEQTVHTRTASSLRIGVPPVATALGFLLFLGGFQLIKDWYLSEGGYEGPRKLWGEKAPDKVWARAFFTKTGQQILRFLDRKDTLSHQELLEAAVQRSKKILALIAKGSRLSI